MKKKIFSKIKITFGTFFQKVVKFCRNNCYIKKSIYSSADSRYIVLIFIELDNLQFVSPAGVYFVQEIVCCYSQYTTLVRYIYIQN